MMNPKVDEHLNKAKKWQPELRKLRQIILDCQLSEEFKWGSPCYTYLNANLIVIWGFKEYCAMGFFKGSLLSDPKGILVKPGENSQAMRQIRFTALQEISDQEADLKDYIHEAIKLEKAGMKVNFKKDAELRIPAELKNKMDGNPELKVAFDALTPGRKRAYCLYFAQAKQSVTRVSRIEKCIPQILIGKGLND